ncbi:MAG TPA: formate dehydrogenase accessory sulfurtransferase FdhD [Dehalococcoidia bacterium]|nr:formate dehydrogenase accessory sulfurtransferase FdhD [Dehalococcoidia bacterium]
MNSQTAVKDRLKPIKCRKLAGGNFTDAEINVVIEKEFLIHVNGQHLVTASITPGMEKEFTVGYLFGQGFIDNINEIDSINLERNAAKVELKTHGKVPERLDNTGYRIVSGGGKTVYFDKAALLEISSGLKTGKSNIFRAMNTLFETSAIYGDTEGVHAAGLFTSEATAVCITEDIGRHNTLDKLIGYALINRVDCRDVFLVSTGRMASEMVTKICRAGIPIAATKTAVTDAGLDIGDKCDLTIAGFVRDAGNKINTDMEVRTVKEAGMKIYTHPERITDD